MTYNARDEKAMMIGILILVGMLKSKKTYPARTAVDASIAMSSVANDFQNAS